MIARKYSISKHNLDQRDLIGQFRNMNPTFGHNELQGFYLRTGIDFKLKVGHKYVSMKEKYSTRYVLVIYGLEERSLWVCNRSGNYLFYEKDTKLKFAENLRPEKRFCLRIKFILIKISLKIDGAGYDRGSCICDQIYITPRNHPVDEAVAF